MALALGALAAGCNKDAILGSNGTAALRPAVTAVMPLSGATGVLTNSLVIATLNEPVAPITGTASMTVTCAAPCVNATGAVTLDATHTVATFTLTPGTTLATGHAIYRHDRRSHGPLQRHRDGGSLHLAIYDGGVTPDLTRPRVSVTDPATTIPGPTPGVPSNTAISATFTQEYGAGNDHRDQLYRDLHGALCLPHRHRQLLRRRENRGVHDPPPNLTVGDTYTATITTAVTDVSGNALAGNQAPLPAASDYVWTFTAAAPSAAGNVSVLSTNPAANATGVCPSAGINATFPYPPVCAWIRPR